jgi:ribosome-associated protein
MQPANLLKFVLHILDEMKAEEITSIDVTPLTDITEAMVVCCGTSNRHTKSIANRLLTESKQQGIQPLGVEGQETGEWILVDLGDVVVHIMLPQTRDFYSLEKLWNSARQLRQEKQHSTP